MLLLAALSICIGDVKISGEELFNILKGGDKESDEYAIVFLIRLPRTLMAAVLGGGLALSGFLLQTFFKNPIAGPFVLGISSGARLAIVIALIISLRNYSSFSSISMVLISFAGSLLSILIILLFSRKVSDNSVLLIAGIMIGYISSAITDFLMTFASDQAIVHMRGWTLGSISGSSLRDVAVASGFIFISSLTVFLLSKPIGALRLGDAYALSLGVNVRSLRIAIITVSGLLSATVTAFAGPVSFVGIAVPYITKRLLKTSDPVRVIPASFLCGSSFLLFCDLVARTAFSPVELNISTVTGLFGAPVVIFILFRGRENK